MDDKDAPFGGPNPDMDELVADQPATDSGVDPQELYDEGLAGAAELGEGELSDTEGDLPDGFHVE